MAGTKTLAALVCTVGLVAGCITSFKQPEIRFEGIRVGALSLRGGTVYAQLHIVNPNGYRLETTSLTYDLELADPGRAGDARWIRLANGLFGKTIAVGARDSTVVEVPIDFTLEGMSGVAMSALGGGTLDYRVRGVIQVLEPMRRNVPYRREGKLSLFGVR